MAKIAPSILAADFARLGAEVEDVLAAGADLIHFDVMDNHYVPNLSVGPLVLSALRRHGIEAPIDVHLMVKPVDRIIGEFIEAGAGAVAIHPEATEHPHRSLALIRDGGAGAGLALNPGTPIGVLEPLLGSIDYVLMMSVNPGFGGQSFLSGSLERTRAVRRLLDESGHTNVGVAIDGGIKVDNIGKSAAAGADTFIAGSAIFGVPEEAPCRRDDYRRVVTAMRDEIGRHVEAGA